MAASAFRLEKARGSIWFLTFDLLGEKVNKLSQAVMADFEQVLTSLEAKPGFAPSGEPIEALVLRSGKRGNFIAGADIEMIQAAKDAAAAQALSSGGHALMNRWEDLPFPTIAAIDGPALGGGCEFALSCRAIVMSDSSAARIGLPEVLLGLVPGMGGCVRLPRKLGLAQAFDLILTGKNLNGERAFKAGLTEAVLPSADFESAVLNWTQKNLADLKTDKRMAREPKLGGAGGVVGSVLEKTPMGRAVIFRQAKAGVVSKTGGHYPAPLAAIELIRKNGGMFGGKLRGKARDKALAREAETFGTLAASDVSKNLIRLFFLTESVKKTTGVAGGGSPVAVSAAGVLGAGVMGGGIAQLFAEKGIVARMKDLNAKALGLGVQAAGKIFKGQVKKRRITQREYLQKMNLVAPTLDFAGYTSVQVVVEAIVENMDIKKKVLADLENNVSKECVIASNTSSLSISEMQKAFKAPERFVGMHFFNPVHRMPLVEVIRGEKSSDSAVATVFELSKKIGKTPIVVKDVPGFLVNRLLAPYMNEATYVLSDGAPFTEIDQAMVAFGMPMGPIELIDEVGVDVAEKVAHVLNDAFGARMTACPLNAKVVGTQRLGKKSGKGFYLYDPKTRKKQTDDGIYALLGLTPRPGAVSPQEIVERCIFPMINEAARCLEEGVVQTASDVDLGMIMGTGFPPFRGGLLRYADTVGVDTVIERLKAYQTRFGARFEPSSALLARAKAKQRFYPVDRADG